MVSRLVLFFCLMGSFFSASAMHEGGKTKDQFLQNCCWVYKKGKGGCYFEEKYIGDNKCIFNYHPNENYITATLYRPDKIFSVINNLNNKKIDIAVMRFINFNKKGEEVEKLSENQLTKTDLELIDKIEKRSDDFYFDCIKEKKDLKRFFKRRRSLKGAKSS